MCRCIETENPEELGEEIWDRVIDVNFKLYFL